MGLDLYAGPLCRLYTGNWESAQRVAARKSGVPMLRIGAPPPLAEIDPDVVVRVLQQASQQIGQVGGADPWTEDMEGPYWTDALAWDGINALRVAAHAVVTGAPLPNVLPDTPPEPQAGSPFLNIVAINLWFPGPNLPPAFRTTDPGDLAGGVTMAGSVPALLASLAALNEQTLSLSEEQMVARIQGDQVDSDAAFDDLLTWALSVMTIGASYAQTQGVPLVLDG